MPFSTPLTPPVLHEATVHYCFEQGLLVPTIRWSAIRADPVVGRQIAQEYEAAPDFDEQALPAYEALRRELPSVLTGAVLGAFCSAEAAGVGCLGE